MPHECYPIKTDKGKDRKEVLKSLLLQRVGVWCEPIGHLKEAVPEL